MAFLSIAGLFESIDMPKLQLSNRLSQINKQSVACKHLGRQPLHYTGACLEMWLYWGKPK
jgi:hypothetical protein